MEIVHTIPSLSLSPRRTRGENVSQRKAEFCGVHDARFLSGIRHTNKMINFSSPECLCASWAGIVGDEDCISGQGM